MKSGKYSKGGRIDKMARSKIVFPTLAWVLSLCHLLGSVRPEHVEGRTEFSYFKRKLPLQNLKDQSKQKY
jgi:hypothetical protein